MECMFLYPKYCYCLREKYLIGMQAELASHCIVLSFINKFFNGIMVRCNYKVFMLEFQLYNVQHPSVHQFTFPTTSAPISIPLSPLSSPLRQTFFFSLSLSLPFLFLLDSVVCNVITAYHFISF